MKKFYAAFWIIVLSGVVAQAQSRLFGERSVFTQYYLTPFLIHPGATGQEDFSQVVGLYRNTWATHPESPRTFAFGYDGTIGNRVGLSILGLSDDFAAFNTTKGVLTLSYTIDSEINKIGFGISGEYIQHQLSGPDLLSELVDLGDQAIVDRLNGYSFLDASIGVYGVYDDKLTYGLSLPSLLSQRLTGEPSSQDREIGLIASVGYKFDMPEQDIVFEPSIYAKKLLFVPFHVDINLKADFLGERLTAALSGSVMGDQRVGFLIGTQLSTFGFHYAYNLSFHEFQQYNNGSHELGLRLRFQPYVANKPGG